MADAHGASWRFIPPPPVVFRRGPDPAKPPAAPAALPSRTLRLAEYLFHAGFVTWKDCCAALAWQRGQRPVIGALAVELRFLTRQDLADLFRRRAAQGGTRLPFGEFAVQEGFLTPAQVVALVGQQRRLQRRIGAWFVEQGLLDEEQLAAAERAMRLHNGRVRRLSAP
jgi:hypothetical protein